MHTDKRCVQKHAATCRMLHSVFQCYNGSAALIVLSYKHVDSAITKARALVQYAKQRVSEQSIVGIHI